MTTIKIPIFGFIRSHDLIGLLSNYDATQSNPDTYDFEFKKLKIRTTVVTNKSDQVNMQLVNGSFNLAIIIMSGDFRELTEYVKYIRTTLGNIPILFLSDVCSYISLDAYTRKDKERIMRYAPISEFMCITTSVATSLTITNRRKESRKKIANYITQNSSRSFSFNKNLVYPDLPVHLKHVKSGKYMSKYSLFGCQYLKLSDKPIEFVFKTPDHLPFENYRAGAIIMHKKKTIYMSKSSLYLGGYAEGQTAHWSMVNFPNNYNPHFHRRVYCVYALTCLFEDYKLPKDVTNIIKFKLASCNLNHIIKISSYDETDECISVSYNNKIECLINDDKWEVIQLYL